MLFTHTQHNQNVWNNALKTKLIACCLLSYLLGATSLLAWHIAATDPMKAPYYSAVSYNLDTGTHLLDGDDVGHKITAAGHYLYDWKYIFNRDKGIQILEELANKGYVGAMGTLSFYHTTWTMDWENWEHNLKAQLSKKDDSFDKALYWARRAAAHGDISPLGRFMALDYLTDVREPVAEDVALVESYANIAVGAAYTLAQYYGMEVNGKMRDADKHAYWLNHYYMYEGFQPAPIDRSKPVLTQWTLYKR